MSNDRVNEKFVVERISLDDKIFQLYLRLLVGHCKIQLFEALNDS